jgi:hypothetical protein
MRPRRQIRLQRIYHIDIHLNPIRREPNHIGKKHMRISGAAGQVGVQFANRLAPQLIQRPPTRQFKNHHPRFILQNQIDHRDAALVRRPDNIDPASEWKLNDRLLFPWPRDQNIPLRTLSIRTLRRRYIPADRRNHCPLRRRPPLRHARRFLLRSPAPGHQQTKCGNQKYSHAPSLIVISAVSGDVSDTTIIAGIVHPLPANPLPIPPFRNEWGCAAFQVP